jgi:hypothetical protein
MPSEQLHEPWRSFLHDLDAQLSGPTEIHCLGGFVVAEYYGLARPTSDIDVIQVRGASDVVDVQRIGGKGSPLARKHRIYVESYRVYRRVHFERGSISRESSRPAVTPSHEIGMLSRQLRDVVSITGVFKPVESLTLER